MEKKIEIGKLPTYYFIFRTDSTQVVEGVAEDSVAAETWFQYISYLVVVITVLCFYVISARILPQSIVGSIALIIALNSVISAIFSFGMNISLQHHLSYYLGNGDLGKIRWAIFFFTNAGIVAAILAGISTYLLGNPLSLLLFQTPAAEETVKITSIYVSISTLTSYTLGMAYGLRLFRVSSILNIIGVVTSYGLAVFMGSLFGTVAAVVFSLILGSTLFLGFLVYYLISYGKTIKAQKSTDFDSILRYSAKVFSYSMTGMSASYVDRFVVAILITLSSMAIYNFDLLIATAMNFLSVPLVNVLFSHFSSKFASSDKGGIKNGVNLGISFLSSIYVPTSVMIAALSTIIILILGGNTYIAGAYPLQIISLTMGLTSFQYVLAKALESIRVLAVFIYSSLAAFASNLVLSIYLIPKFSLTGAAIGYSSIFVVGAIFVLYYSIINGIFSAELVSISKIWGSAILMFIAVKGSLILLGGTIIGIPLYLFVGMIVYALSMRGMKVFGRNDIEILFSFIPKEYKIAKVLYRFLIPKG